MIPSRPILCSLLLACTLAGCKRPESRVYYAPREADTVAAASKEEAHSPNDGHDHGPQGAEPKKPERPEMTFFIPPNWKETAAGQVSTANYEIVSAAGKAVVNVTPLSTFSGKEELVVNMWREQVGQGQVAREEITKAFSPAPVGSENGTVYEVTGTREGKPAKLVGAILHRTEGTWFFKLLGDEAVVTAEKGNFLEFLKTVKFGEPEKVPAATSAAPAPTPVVDGTTASPKPEPTVAGTVPATSTAATTQAPAAAPGAGWSVPPDWKPLPAGQMQVAKFAVPDQAAAKAEVAISVFPSDTGGALANVNRWRGQLGLQPTDDAGVKDSTKPLPAAGEGATLTTLINGERQMLVAIVPRAGQWWFYKLFGDTAAVTAAQAALLSLAQSAPPASVSF